MVWLFIFRGFFWGGRKGERWKGGREAMKYKGEGMEEGREKSVFMYVCMFGWLVVFGV